METDTLTTRTHRHTLSSSSLCHSLSSSLSPPLSAALSVSLSVSPSLLLSLSLSLSLSLFSAAMRSKLVSTLSEDPLRNFLPSIGPLNAYTEPPLSGCLLELGAHRSLPDHSLPPLPDSPSLPSVSLIEPESDPHDLETTRRLGHDLRLLGVSHSLQSLRPDSVRLLASCSEWILVRS
jgi:hypothetical protein